MPGWGDCNGDPSDGCESALTTCYKDADGDGFVVDGSATQMCACGKGWTPTLSAKFDCDDNDSNAYPGETAYFGTRATMGSYDYDCNGTEDPQFTLSCNPPGATLPCTQRHTWGYYNGFPTKAPACGEQGALIPCVQNQMTGECVPRGDPYNGDLAIQTCR
jgi:hypothetical protein